MSIAIKITHTSSSMKAMKALKYDGRVISVTEMQDRCPVIL